MKNYSLLDAWLASDTGWKVAVDKMARARPGVSGTASNAPAATASKSKISSP